MREWENQGTSNEKGISENYQSIEWTRVRTSALHDLYEAAPLGNFDLSSKFLCFVEEEERIPCYKICPKRSGSQPGFCCPFIILTRKIPTACKKRPMSIFMSDRIRTKTDEFLIPIYKKLFLT